MIRPVLDIKDLHISLEENGQRQTLVEDVSLSLPPGKTLALVGESGCGKSVCALALMGLLPSNLEARCRSFNLGEAQMTSLDDAQIAPFRGKRLSMIFQEPMSALNPVFSIGEQISETILCHQGLEKRQALELTYEMLERVGISDPIARAKSYPHQLSGGLRQRVMIAIALCCHPEILIADEPTTALDVTIQAQILDLLLDIQESFNTAILFISHDLSVVSRIADNIAVMYCGRIIEQGMAAKVLMSPCHPYTRGLLNARPKIEKRLSILPAIPGRVPAPDARLPGCAFKPRCTKAREQCFDRPPFFANGSDHSFSCWEGAK